MGGGKIWGLEVGVHSIDRLRKLWLLFNYLPFSNKCHPDEKGRTEGTCSHTVVIRGLNCEYRKSREYTGATFCTGRYLRT